MSYVSQNFYLFHVPNLSVANFRISLRMYPGTVSDRADQAPSTAHIESDTHTSRTPSLRKYAQWLHLVESVSV